MQSDPQREQTRFTSKAAGRTVMAGLCCETLLLRHHRRQSSIFALTDAAISTPECSGPFSLSAARSLCPGQTAEVLFAIFFSPFAQLTSAVQFANSYFHGRSVRERDRSSRIRLLKEDCVGGFDFFSDPSEGVNDGLQIVDSGNN